MSSPRSRLRIIATITLALVTVSLIYTGIRIASSAYRLTSAAQIGWQDFFASVPSQSTADGAVTVLVLGIGGGDHEGPTLTDSIMVVRYEPDTNTIRTLGLPRDIWDPDTKDKINSTYTYGLQQRPRDPLIYVKEKFDALADIGIDHVVVVDFGTFATLVDDLGGIQVRVETGFVDDQYPIAGAEERECEPYDPEYRCRYETVSFPTGTIHMNGATALKYARSRHAVGDEGTDFARSKRQQAILTALRDSLMGIVQRRDVSMLTKIVATLERTVKRTIPQSEVLALTRGALLSDHKIALEHRQYPTDYFVVGDPLQYEDRYVLTPPDEDYYGFRIRTRRLLEGR